MDDRIEILNETRHSKNTLYLMQRDQRVYKNHSFNLAYEISTNKKSKFFIGIFSESHKANQIQNYFMLDGLISLNQILDNLNIPLIMIYNLHKAIEVLEIDSIVVEFCPLREYLSFHEDLLKFCVSNNISFYRCDSHNIVPCKLLKTYLKTPSLVRAELKKYFQKFNVEYPTNKKYIYNTEPLTNSEHYNPLNMHPRTMIYLGSKFKSGCEAAQETLKRFIQNKLKGYKKYRNQVDKNFLSNLSPYLHFGQISAHHIVTEALQHREAFSEDVDCFINEVFYWRETAEHFCLHEKNYDNIKGAPRWAATSLKLHRSDEREVIYTLEQLESAKTNDKEWNAAQYQLLGEYKIHAYVRMYWAKSLLKWTQNEEIALSYAIYLNDMLSIDGNDPNGYLGVMWSICGVMDHEFEESKYLGKIRPMKSIRAKEYVDKWNQKSDILQFAL